MVRSIAFVWMAFSSAAPASAEAQGREEVEALDVPGYEAAAFVPARGTGPRPVVVGLHGNFDRPEWMCGAWASIIRGRAFLLCPRGLPRSDAPGQDRWSLPLAHPLALEIAAGRRALAERYPGRVDDGPDIYVGFSQGAHRISRMAAASPERFPRIQLVEGGNALWRDDGARRYARRPGRAALVCAMRWCEQRGERLQRTLRAGRAEAELERRPAAHHDLQTMFPAIERTFEWLIAGDPRFVP